MLKGLIKRTPLLACLVLAVLGTGLVLTNLPFADEGFYGVPAYFLATTGQLRNPVMETAGVPTMTGIHSILYWMTPGAIVLQAAVFRLFGFSIIAQRGLSLVAALGTLCLWFSILRRLLDERVAGLACLLLSVDCIFTSLATRGRADMLSLFFGSAALACYLALRERSMTKALLAANACCAVSGMIHPNGGIATLLSLSAVVLYFDRRRLKAKLLIPVAVPYLALGAVWAWWIDQAPAYFAAQFLGNAGGRMPHGFGGALRGEVLRYLSAFGATGSGMAAHARILIPLAYVIAAAGSWSLRKRVRHVNLLLLLAALQAGVLLVTEGSKQGWYLVDSMPVLDALLACWLVHLWSSRTKGNLMLLAAHVAVILAVAAGLAGLVIKRHYQREYAPTIAFLNSHVTPGQTVFGRSELFFGMKCKTCLIDDERLGARSRRAADWLVLDPDYAENIDKDRSADPSAYQFIQHRLATGYVREYENDAFDVRAEDPRLASNSRQRSGL